MMATYLELKTQAKKLLQQAETLRKKEIAKVVADMKDKIKQYGLTANDLGFGAGGRKKTFGEQKIKTRKKKVAVKYRGLGGEEWSGRGRPPAWLKEAMANGKKKEDFSV